ncbi:MAG TPA: protein kinase [Labilithrix sp.]|nr:protein kinase [Labilithrix sp.]
MSETADPALIGRRVAGKFVVEQWLGGGAMGAVYRARDDSLDRKVALKVMHPSVAVDPTFVGRFHREARAASRLDHPNSMRVIEFGEEPDGLLYIAMEYLEGRDLYKVIHQDWPLPEARIADILMKALAAIAVAHDMGVIHRDLKPDNIMILDRKDDEGHDIVKVCDFGIAKITETEDGSPGAGPKTAGIKVTTAGLVVGTPEYMSPEQARGEKLDSRSDLYSLGIILYQLLTGRTPFLADTPLAVVLKHITEEPQPPNTIYPDVHKGLEAVCMRALAKTKEGRFQSARDMRAAIKAAIDGRPLPASTDGTHSNEVPVPSEAPASSVEGTGNATSPVTRALTGGRDRGRVPVLVGTAFAALVIGAVGVVLVRQGEERAAAPAGPASSESATAIKIHLKPTSGPSASVAPSSTAKPLKHTPSSTKATPVLDAKAPPPIPTAEPNDTPSETDTSPAPSTSARAQPSASAH